jgi:serine protease inhibitor
MRPIAFARYRSFLAFLPMLGACTAEPPPPRVIDKAKIEITDDVRGVAVHSNEFAFDLYERLRKTDGNLFFSPASVSTALAMTSAGAGGQTKEQIARVLHIDAADERVHKGFGEMARILRSNGERYQLRMANRLWGSEGYPFRPAFLTLTREVYGGLDGASKPPGEDKPTVFNADHPFMFLIRDVRSGAILFLGRLANPIE